MEITQRGKRFLDVGDLTQVMIIIAGIAVAAVVFIGATAGVLLNKGESAAGCIAEFSSMESGNDSVRECKNIEEEAVTASGGVITAHYGTSVDSAAFMERAQKIAMQKEDLTEITKTIEQFYEEHGRYPISKAETAGLDFTAQEEAYSDYGYNFHYCPSVDGKTYVASGFTRGPEGKGVTITYTSNKNSVPRSYYTEAKQGIRVNEQNESIGGGSWCYNGIEDSTADRAGVTGIGGDMTDMGNNRFIVPKHGWSGINTLNNGFANK